MTNNSETAELKKKLEFLESELAKSQQSVQKYHSIFEKSPVIEMIVSITDNKIKEVNSYFEKITGYSRHEIIGKTPVEAGIYVLTEYNRLVNEYSKADQIESFETIIIDKNDCKHNLYLSCQQTIIDSNPCLLMSAMEITSMVCNEQETKHHLNDLETISQIAKDLIVVKTMDELFELFAHKIESVTGSDYTLVSHLDPMTDSFQIRKLLGLNKTTEFIFKMLGYDPRKSAYPRKKMDISWDIFTKNKLLKTENGVYTISGKLVPLFLANQLEKLFGVESCYTMGFYCKNELYGSVSLFFKEGNKLKKPWLAENLINFTTLVIQRLEAERVFSEYENIYRVLADNVSDVIWTSDIDLTVSYITPSIEALTGKKTSDFLGFSLCIHFNDASVAIIEKELFKVKTYLKEKKPINFLASVELELTKNDGSTILVEIRTSVINHDESNYSTIIGVIRDISKRKLTEIALLEREKNLRLQNDIIHNQNERIALQNQELKNQNETLLSNNETFKKLYNELKSSDEHIRYILKHIPISVAVLDAENKFVMVSDQYCRDFQIKTDPIGANIKDIFGNALPQLQSIFEKVLNGEVESSEDNIYTQPNGQIDYLSFELRPWFNSNHQIAGIIMSSRIYTEQKIAKQALVESEEKHRIISELISDYVYSVKIDKNGQIKLDWIIGAFEKITGYKPEHIKSLPNGIYSIINQDDEKKINFQRLVKIINDQNYVFEYRIITRDNKTCWIRDFIKPIFDDNSSKVTGYLGAVVDITQQKHYEEELIKSKDKAEESDKLKSAFLANMSHEIRTPMNGIVGFSELLGKPGITDEKRIKFIEIIKSRSRDLLNIIDEIICFSKIEAGQMQVNESITNINEVFDDIYQFFSARKELSENKKLNFTRNIDLPDHNMQIITDPVRLKQIFINLIENAYKFTPKGCIEFGCYLPDKNMLRFYVKDTGIGIPKDKLSIIFERFRQVDDSATRKYGGTGLGLSICKGLVDILGGSIWVESKYKVGSTFYFTLPYKPVHKSFKTNTTELFSKKFNLQQYTILLVEDDEISLTFLETMLEETGINTIIAVDGQQAVNLCLSRPNIDIVLMDIQLPGISGLEATKRIKLQRPTLPIIAQTAFALNEERSLCIEAGCNEVVTKPYSSNTILETINDFLKNVKK